METTGDFRIYMRTVLTGNDYQEAALRTEPDGLTDMEKITNGLMGLNGESGEAIDILKKHLYQGHDLDKRHLALELGDIAWYLAITANALGYDLETIFAMNLEKLRKRYPERFDSDLSIHRKDGDI